jgi:hypothetical protein
VRAAAERKVSGRFARNIPVLKHYSFFSVRSSPLIAEIENQNGCHSHHRPGLYSKFSHWIATFHEESLEVVALRALVGMLSGVSTPAEAVRMSAKNRQFAFGVFIDGC